MEALEERSERQFDTWARWFDQRLGWFFSLANRHLLRLLAPDARSRVLDVGCGTGILLQQMHELDTGLRLFGVDISFQMLTSARAKLPGSVALHQGSASSLPYCSDAFDYVTCATSFHHYSDPLRALREMHRVLKPDGQLLFCEHGLSEEPAVARWQNRITPVWKRFAGGCHLNRPIAELLQEGHFAIDQLLGLAEPVKVDA